MTRPFAITFPEVGRTKQEFKNECDINYMLATYQRTGIMPPVNPNLANYGDFSTVPDFHAALNQVKEAEIAFAALPSGVRSRFKNDPGELIDFLSDPENNAEAVEMGLMDPPPRQPGEEPPASPEPSPDPTPEPAPSPDPVETPA